MVPYLKIKKLVTFLIANLSKTKTINYKKCTKLFERISNLLSVINIAHTIPNILHNQNPVHIYNLNDTINIKYSRYLKLKGDTEHN